MGRGSICAGSTLGERLCAVRGDGRAGGVFFRRSVGDEWLALMVRLKLVLGLLSF